MLLQTKETAHFSLGAIDRTGNRAISASFPEIMKRLPYTKDQDTGS